MIKKLLFLSVGIVVTTCSASNVSVTNQANVYDDMCVEYLTGDSLTSGTVKNHDICLDDGQHNHIKPLILDYITQRRMFIASLIKSVSDGNMNASIWKDIARLDAGLIKVVCPHYPKRTSFSVTCFNPPDKSLPFILAFYKNPDKLKEKP